MASWYCEHCGTGWPYAKAYTDCPACQESTNYSAEQPDLTVEQAKAAFLMLAEQRRRQELFERYYVERAVLELYRDIEAWLAVQWATDKL